MSYQIIEAETRMTKWSFNIGTRTNLATKCLHSFGSWVFTRSPSRISNLHYSLTLLQRPGWRWRHILVVALDFGGGCLQYAASLDDNTRPSFWYSPGALVGGVKRSLTRKLWGVVAVAKVKNSILLIPEEGTRATFKLLVALANI